jgi:predicted DNA-binding transcriptional regulator AlpA
MGIFRFERNQHDRIARQHSGKSSRSLRAMRTPRLVEEKPNLVDLVRDPSKISIVDIEEIPGLLGDLEKVRAFLLARLVSGSTKAAKASGGDDRLLDVEETAEMLSTTSDWLYRNAKRLPFTVRIAPQQLRFSRRGIQKFIKNHHL